MPFPTSKVGLALDPSETELTPRTALAYAAGLGACEPAFLDDAAPAGLAALPFFCVSPEWPVVLSMRRLLGESLRPEEAQRAVHAVQDSSFHRPMRPGERLVTEGRLVSATEIRSGVLAVCKLETRDHLSGEPVTTTWTSSIYRDVRLDGDGVTLEPPPALPELVAATLGPNARTTRIPIPREMPHVYSECADIWNPIHTERAVALAAGLPDIILHGTATWALAGLTILRQEADCDIARLKRMTGRFSGMIIPGETIEVRHEAGEGGLIRFEVRTESGALAISQGAAWL
jgi:acyl dehydratase